MIQLLKRFTGKACLYRRAFPFVVVLSAFALAQPAADSWELRFCADPDAWPFSAQATPGFENVIAQIIADELGASLTFDWTPQDSNMIRDRLNGGECDVIAGVPDEAEGVLHTVSYYTSPYVFVVPGTADYATHLTLDSPELGALRIGVQVASMPPHEALLNRGLNDQVVYGGLNAQAGGRPDAVLEELEAGSIDVALVWGPVAGGWLQNRDGYHVIPVEPMIEPPFLQQVLPMTMAVRMGDVSLRDDLNAAIAARWEEVQDTLTDFDVPVLAGIAPRVPEPVTAPTTFALVAPADLRPAPVGVALHALVGEAALRGARLAAEELLRADSSAPELLLAVAPNEAAAARAADRLAARHQPAALLGGIRPGQLEVLQATGIPVINIGEAQLEPPAGIIHAQATVRMYMEAMVRWYGASQWFIVHEDSADGNAYADAFEAAVQEFGSGAVVTGSAAVTAATPYFGSVLAEAEGKADAVAVLLDPRDQLSFMAQSATASIVVAVYPHSVTQSRDYLAAVAQRTPSPSDLEILVYFEPTAPHSTDLNTSYSARWGAPMEPAAFSAWQAVHWLANELKDGTLSQNNTFLACNAGDSEISLPVVSFLPAERFDRSLESLLHVVEPVGTAFATCP